MLMSLIWGHRSRFDSVLIVISLTSGGGGGRLALALAGVLLLVAALVGIALPANAQDSARTRTPIVAGTALVGSGGRVCTVGAVLKRNGPGSALSPFLRAVRYLVLAKHCAPEIGAAYSLNSVQIGTVSWMSATDDVELVQVPPEVTLPQGCFGSINGCFIGSTARPRAVGQVIMRVQGSERAVPMLPPASPALGERFCTSGSTTGLNCYWLLQEGRGRDPVAQGFATSALGLDFGDSGGPVISQQGQLYGIIQSGGMYGALTFMWYMPIDQLFRQLDHEFDIAPR
ncbi:hypothetical protein ACVLV4_002247 [Rathayibacter agropyri]